VGAFGGEADAGGGIAFGEPLLEFGANTGLEIGFGSENGCGGRKRAG